MHVHVFYFGLSQCGERLGCQVPFCSADLLCILGFWFHISNELHKFGVTVHLDTKK